MTDCLLTQAQRTKGVNPKSQPQHVRPFSVVKVYDNHPYRHEGFQSVVAEVWLELHHSPALNSSSGLFKGNLKVSSSTNYESCTDSTVPPHLAIADEHGDDNIDNW